MKTSKTKIIFIICGCLYVFHFLFFWFIQSTDSIFYYLFARYMSTGSYFAPSPYLYNQPSTMEPPLYSVLIFLTQPFVHSDILLHGLQLIGIYISGILIYKICRFYMKDIFSLLVSILFLLFPAHIIYASNMVAEPIAIFYITVYLYLLHLILNRKRWSWLGPLLVFSSIISLHRYNLLGFLVIGLFLFIFRKQKTKSMWVGCLGGVFILLFWVVINHSLNGAWSFSNAEGKHLWNRILHYDHILPDENNPSFTKFRELTGKTMQDDFFKPWWFYEPLLMEKLGTETASSNLMQEVAIAAFLHNPMRYILHIPGYFLWAHMSNPTYDDPLYLYSGTMQRNCVDYGSIRFCDPIIKASFAPKLWDILVKTINWFYLFIWQYFNYVVLFPSLLYVLIQKDRFLKLCGVLYVGSVLFFVLAEAPLPRYTYIFTPLWFLVTAAGILQFKKGILKK